MFSNWPGSPPSDSSASVRSSSSVGGLSSSSSLGSTFSDTHAFFVPALPSMPPSAPGSITADFFATPVRSPSPPAKPTGLLAAIHPSRHTSRDTGDDRRRTRPDLPFLDLDPEQAINSPSSLSTTNPHRLPTPPPASPLLPDNTNEPTPRPSHLEPSYARHSRDSVHDGDDAHSHDVEPAPGSIITSNPPRISNPSPAWLTVTPPPAPAPNTNLVPQPELSSNGTRLHLIRPLGQGAFSSVWLAQDKSLIPLTLKSKKSIRELRTKASLANIPRNPNALGIPSNNSSVVSLSRRSSLEDKPLGRDGSLRMRKLRAKVRGTRPVGFGTRYLDERHGEMGIRDQFAILEPSTSGSDAEHGPTFSSPPISASNSLSDSVDWVGGRGEEMRTRKSSKRGRLVAVKMTPRRAPGFSSSATDVTKRDREEEERTRVGFVREVEVLKHISHPNITVLLEHLSTSSHHILVLPYLPGGDLLGLVNNDIAWSKLGENILRRIWCELCKAVGWMHGVGLVHRDIKLENILLTTHCFSRLTPTSPRPTLDKLPIPPSPLIKLSDFGLSRFIQVDETGEGELLWTRCGSEAYAAPELVMGTGSVRAQAQAQGAIKRHRGISRGDESSGVTRGFYDARETDAWACGVVLYALVGRCLPFGEGVGALRDEQREGRIGGDGLPGYGYGHGHGRGNASERRQWLMKIARGEYEWPSESTTLYSDTAQELVGQELVKSEGVKRIVGRLLVRDPRKRARIINLWDDEWMWGFGGGLAVGMTEAEWRERESGRQRERVVGLGIDFGGGGGDSDGKMSLEETVEALSRTEFEVEEEEVGEGVTIDVEYVDEGLREGDAEDGEEGEECEEEVDGEEGWLLDQEGIGSVARQEVV